MPGNNILGVGFKEYTSKQIALRQQKLSRKSQYDDDFIKYINNKAPYIRLSSGVNLSADRAQQLGVAPGNELAKQYILTNLTTSGIGYSSGNSYGYASNTTYGYVPLPGILSAEIKPLNNGTLREATVQITCHNLYQFLILESLYMKLKYSVLLEWGHSVWYDNAGTLRTDFPGWIQTGFLENGLTNLDTALSSLELARDQSSGNYDAFLGWVKNFSWNLRPDGGYDITLNLISLGDVIESLKLNINYPSAQLPPEAQATTETEADTPSVVSNKTKSSIHRILYAIRQEVDKGGFIDKLDYDTIVNITKAHSQLDLVSANYKNTDANYSTSQECIKTTFSQLKSSPEAGSTNFYFIKLGALLRIIEAFFLKYDTSNGTQGSHIPLFRIDFNYNNSLCLALPHQISSDPQVCLLKSGDPSKYTNSDGSQPAAASTQYNKTSYVVVEEEIEASFSNLSLGTNNFYWTKTTSTVTGDDPEFQQARVGLANETSGTQTKNDESTSEPRILTVNGVSAASLNQKLIVYTPIDTYNTNATVVTTDADGDTVRVANANNVVNIWDGYRDFQGGSYPFLGKFMHVHINLDFISKTLSDNMDKDGKVSIYEFLEKLILGVQDAIGQINDFRLLYDETTNYFNIIDKNVLPDAEKYLNIQTKPTIFHVNTLSTTQGSFVTDVSIKSELNNNFATMITVGAQQNGNVVGENATALSRLNEGYEDRVIKDKSSIVDKATTEASGSKSPLDIYKENLAVYALVNNKINDGTITYDDISNNKQAIADVLTFELGYFTQQGNIAGQGFIPLSLQLTIDGLSGLRLLESYEINTELLPPNYQNSIKFITKGITHKIDTSGWSTTIESFSGPKRDTLAPVANFNFFVDPAPDLSGTGGGAAPAEAGGNTVLSNPNGCKTFDNVPDVPWDNKQYVNTFGIGVKSNPYKQNRINAGIQNGSDSGLVPIRIPSTIGIRLNGEKAILVPEAVAALELWATEVANQGACFTITSAFRTIAEQERLFATLPAGKAARPGTSAHGWGLAIDISELYRLVGGSTQGPPNATARQDKRYRYIASTGAKYGWYNVYLLSDNKKTDECWHFEYWGTNTLA
jgi:hypothetical protein